LRSLPRLLWLTLEALAVLLLVWIAVSVTVAAFTRKFLAEPFEITVPLSEYALLLITFLVAPVLAHRGGHVSLDAVDALASVRVKRVLARVSHAIVAGVSAVVATVATVSAISNAQAGTTVYGLIATPRWIFLSVIAVGFALTAVTEAILMVKNADEKLDVSL
jgi:TRAP-type C4-dicarboxylate transport system permease small subunit